MPQWRSRSMSGPRDDTVGGSAAAADLGGAATATATMPPAKSAPAARHAAKRTRFMRATYHTTLAPRTLAVSTIEGRMDRAAWALAASLAAAPLAACGGGTPGARSPDRPLPPYTGHAVDLFDDGIEPSAVGYPTDQGVNPAGDARLRERTQTGDEVVLARVTTVT